MLLLLLILSINNILFFTDIKNRINKLIYKIYDVHPYCYNNLYTTNCIVKFKTTISTIISLSFDFFIYYKLQPCYYYYTYNLFFYTQIEPCSALNRYKDNFYIAQIHSHLYKI